jgi:chromosomal replication initiator protein
MLGMAARFGILHPAAQVVCTTASDFAREFADAVELDSMSEFRAKFRGADFLAVDGLEEFAGKRAAQLEFMHTTDELAAQRRHLLMVARAVPTELQSLLPGLRSRLSAGLCVPFSMPSSETRRALLHRLATNNSLRVSRDAVDALVEGAGGRTSPLRTVPELQNALFELAGHHAKLGEQIDEQSTLEYLAERTDDEKPSVRLVTKRVAKYFRLRVTDVTGPSRRQAPVRARGIAMYLSRELTGASYQSIGRQFHYRDHTTVLHACRRTEELIQTEPEIKQAVHELLEQLSGTGNWEHSTVHLSGQTQS